MKTKAQKQVELDEARELLLKSEAVLLVDFSKVKTADLRNLRKELKGAANPFLVIKKRLLGLLLKEKGMELQGGDFKVATGAAFASSLASAARLRGRLSWASSCTCSRPPSVPSCTYWTKNPSKQPKVDKDILTFCRMLECRENTNKTMANEKFNDIIAKIEGLTSVELAELVKALEEKFGISAAAPVMAGGGNGAAAAEEKTSWNVMLKSGGEQKINVIKVVREVTALGLKEAKGLVDGAPKVVKEGLKKEEAEEIKAKIEAAGAVAEIQ